MSKAFLLNKHRITSTQQTDSFGVYDQESMEIVCALHRPTGLQQINPAMHGHHHQTVVVMPGCSSHAYH